MPLWAVVLCLELAVLADWGWDLDWFEAQRLEAVKLLRFNTRHHDEVVIFMYSTSRKLEKNCFFVLQVCVGNCFGFFVVRHVENGVRQSERSSTSSREDKVLTSFVHDWQASFGHVYDMMDKNGKYIAVSMGFLRALLNDNPH